MAEHEKTHKRASKVVTLDGADGTEAPPPAEKPTPAAAEPRPKGFWNKVKSIPAVEWGKRAWIYVYCLEPICNLKIAGENKYLVKSAEPITDEDSIMHDYGSGKYRLNLVYRKPAADRSDEVDATEIEIYNPKYPPKIPRSAWMNDPRNERWAALLPKEEPPKKDTDVLQTFQTFTQIQKEMREDMKPAAQPQSTDVERFAAMATAVKSLMPAPAPATDNTLLNTIVTLMNTQVQASQAEAKQLREQVFQLLEKRTEEPAAKGETLETFIDKFDKILPKLKGVFNLGGEALTNVVHGRPRPFLEELGLAVLPPFAQNAAPLIPMLAARFLQPAQPQQQNGYGQGQVVQQQPNPAALPPGQPQNGVMQATPQTRLIAYLQEPIMAKALERYITGYIRGQEGTSGSDFGALIADLSGDGPLRDAEVVGVDGLIGYFKTTQAWNLMQPYEPRIREFIEDTIGYLHRDEEETEEPAAEPATKGFPASSQQELGNA